MAGYLSPQTTELDWGHSPITHVDRYPPSVGTVSPTQPSIIQPMDTLISPPLSAIELADIAASETEFSAEEVRVYNNVNDLINELRAERLRFQREHR